MAMIVRKRKTYDYREASGRLLQAGMSEAAAESVAQEIGTVLTEYTVSRDEFEKLNAKLDELIVLVKGLKERLEKMDERLKRMNERVERVDERLLNVETKTDTIPDLKVAIVEGRLRNIRWIVRTMIAISVLFGSLSAGFSYLLYSAAIG